MPFISHRVFDWAPIEITPEWDLERYGIGAGTAYTVCNTLSCRDCSHIFLDMRFNNFEMSKLYRDYREEEYLNLREKYEPGYKIRNEKLKSGYNYIDKIESFLLPHVKKPQSLKILDWGGDTGKNTPFYSECEFLYIYDISEKSPIGEAKRINKDEIKVVECDLFVCSNVLEHIPFPEDTLCEINSAMKCDAILYIELPYENLVRQSEEQNELQNAYKKKNHWHEHVNFFTDTSIRELVHNSGFEVLELRKLEISGETSNYVFQIVCRRKINTEDVCEQPH